MRPTISLSSAIQQVEAPEAPHLSFGDLPTADLSAMESVCDQSTLQKWIEAFQNRPWKSPQQSLKRKRARCGVALPGLSIVESEQRR